MSKFFDEDGAPKFERFTLNELLDLSTVQAINWTTALKAAYIEWVRANKHRLTVDERVDASEPIDFMLRIIEDHHLYEPEVQNGMDRRAAKYLNQAIKSMSESS